MQWWGEGRMNGVSCHVCCDLIFHCFDHHRSRDLLITLGTPWWTLDTRKNNATFSKCLWIPRARAAPRLGLMTYVCDPECPWMSTPDVHVPTRTGRSVTITRVYLDAASSQSARVCYAPSLQFQGSQLHFIIWLNQQCCSYYTIIFFEEPYFFNSFLRILSYTFTKS